MVNQLVNFSWCNQNGAFVTKSFRANSSFPMIYLLKGTSIQDNLLHQEENKLQLSFQEIGFQLVRAPSGSGIQCIQGNFSRFKLKEIVIEFWCCKVFTIKYPLLVYNSLKPPPHKKDYRKSKTQLHFSLLFRSLIKILKTS